MPLRFLGICSFGESRGSPLATDFDPPICTFSWASPCSLSSWENFRCDTVAESCWSFLCILRSQSCHAGHLCLNKYQNVSYVLHICAPRDLALEGFYMGQESFKSSPSTETCFKFKRQVQGTPKCWVLVAQVSQISAVLFSFHFPNYQT